MLVEACDRAVEFESMLSSIKENWQRKTGFRAKSAGSQLLDILLGTPALSVKTAQEMTGKSYPAARSAINALVDAGILRQNAKNRKSGIYVAEDVVDAFTSYERSLATISGDTLTEKPRRSVPQRKARS